MVGPRSETLVGLRARCIRNPVARLRYLRTATGAIPARRSSWVRGRRVLALSVLACLTLLYPSFRASDEDTETRVGTMPALDETPAEPVTDPLAPPHVWQVDRRGDHEIYSNGLRIETGSTVRNEPRRWKRFEVATGEVERGEGPPVGIVFHSTESHIARFAPEQTMRLRRAGESVLEYVRRNRSYNYLIDRFGRVHRVVDEADAAFHAGVSIWGDDRHVWVNLNESFLGVSLEAATSGGNGDRDPITPAQVHALKTLTAMLRSRYAIDAANCVTHAQVSVAAGRRLLGHHTDWASGFPFADAGLPDNYALPLASVTTFGFIYDAEFLAAGAAAWTGLAVSEREVRRAAAAAGLAVAEFRTHLHDQYRTATARLAREKESNP
jgi:hypothetical protein